MRGELWEFLVLRQDLVRGDDGMWVYWPSGWNHGALQPHDLEQIARRMRKENRANADRLARATQPQKADDASHG